MAEQTFSPTDAQRPFPGLRSFQESNKEQFGGREQEISDLMNLCDQGILTLVFGQSGIGKTSLLQAGLMPRLQKSLNIPVLIRIDYSSTKSPLEQVKNILYEKLKPVFPSLHPVGDRSLWRYFHEEALEDGLLIPVLIFDQFEEVFTLGKKKAAEVREFITELSDLAENRIPFRDQQAFRNELSTSISHFSNHPYRIIISLREDFLAQMEGLKTEMPSLLIQRYRVLRMNVLQAMDAAMRPAQGLINKEIARELISRIPGVKPEDFSSEEHNLRPVVEPFLLSLLCYQMNEERIRKGAQVFTSELVQQFNVANAIEDYYRQVMEQFPSSISDSIENELLTEGGFRKLETLELMQNQYGWNEAVVQQLTDLRIIRKEERDGVQYIELIHDVLTPTIKSRRDQRVMRQMEKTKSEEIRRAIDLDRRRSRKRFQTVFISAVLLLVSVGWYLKEREAKRLRDQQLAEKILRISNNMADNYGELAGAGAVSRLAYILYRENDGRDFNPFYKTMFNHLSNGMGIDFSVAYTDVEVSSILCGQDKIFCGLSDGTVFQKSWKPESPTAVVQSPDTLFSFENEKVTSLAISKNNRWLAAKGKYSDVVLVDLNNRSALPVHIPHPRLTVPAKGLSFIGNDTLALLCGSSVYRWQIRQPVKNLGWNVLKPSAGSDTIPVQSGNDHIEVTHMNFNRMEIMGNRFVLSLDSNALVILSDSDYQLVRSVDFGTITAIKADPEGKYLYVGNDFGIITRYDISNQTTERNQYQMSRINSMSVSADGHYLATANSGGSVSIYDLKSPADWEKQIAIECKLKGCESDRVNAVSFDPTGRRVVAGYASSTALSWPSNPEILSSIIDSLCKNLNMDSIRQVYLNQLLRSKELKKYLHTK